MAKTTDKKQTQPETPEPPQIMDPQSLEEREKKKQPLSQKERGARAGRSKRKKS
ncbi:MAG TPA: hypothetical protein VKZ86_12070 [Cyclobacteriaceae bacterium]|nr:hypothetical protein [Cyclobacteriaceae bacterium]